MNSIVISKYLRSPYKGRGKCRKCLKLCPWAKERVAMHLRNCEKSTEDEKKLYPTQAKSIQNKSSLNFGSEKSSQQNSINNDQPHNQNVSQELKHAIANFIYKSGVSFHCVELDCFKEIFAVIDPVLIDAIPSQKQLSNNLLDIEYNKIQQQLQDILSNSTNLTLITDGWTDVSGHHIVNYCIKAPGIRTFFYKSINTSGTSQTSTEIATQICNVIEELGSHKFISVVTDNANSMKGAWTLIEKKYPHIACNGCSAHMINLLIKDILELETFRNTLKEAQKIIKFVKNHDSVNAKYEQIKKEQNVNHRLSMPVTTRWYSNFNSIKNLIDSKYVLIKLVDDHKNELRDVNPKDNSKEVIKLIERNNFWEKLTKVSTAIEYPTNIIGKLEKDDSQINNVYHYFGKLFIHYQQDKTIQRLVKNRWDLILTESMGAAYMLTPKFSVDGYFVDHDKMDIVTHIKKIIKILSPTNTNYVEEEFAKFINTISSLPDHKKIMIYEMNPKSYWNFFGKSKFPTLFICANYLFDMVSSSASSERVWSAFGFIHSKLRNRLTTVRVEKLISIYVNHSIIKQEGTFENIFDDDFLLDEFTE